MTAADAVEETKGNGTTAGGVEAARERLARARSVALRVCVGTRLGLVVFLATLAFLALYWRLQYYGRNYGQIAFALPFLWALEGLATVADPGLVLPMCWALVVVALGRETGRVLDRPALGTSAGAVFGLAGFAANVVVARPLSPKLMPVAAFQLASMVTAAVAVATLYRLVARLHGRRAGVAAAGVTALATPVGFWAVVPKRHVTAIALVLGACYALARSRADPSPDDLVSPLGFRAAAYGLVGLFTWVHGGEAFAAFLALVAVDAPGGEWDRRSVAVVGGVFLLSLLPFLVTNALVTGDPLRPPRMISSFGDVPGDTIGSGSDNGGGSRGSRGIVERVLAALPPVVVAPLDVTFDRVSILLGQFYSGGIVLVTDPGRLAPVLVRGGDITGVSERNFDETIYLTVTEAAPVVAGLGALAATGMVTAAGTLGERPAGGVARTLRGVGERVRSRLVALGSSPAGVADAFCLASGVLFLLLYLPVLPLHAQVTVRYLLVLYPLAVYGMARQAPLRRALGTHWRAALWTWVGGVLVGAQLFVAGVTAGSLARGEAMQVHAFAGLAVAGAFGALAATAVVTDRVDRATAVAAGLAAALGTDFLLLSGLVYFQYGQYALPAAGWVAD
ncbi:hypothetical protein BRC74_01595, partial [Halobacteriales archaeon QH_7_68_42]